MATPLCLLPFCPVSILKAHYLFIYLFVDSIEIAGLLEAERIQLQRLQFGSVLSKRISSLWCQMGSTQGY